MPFWSPKPKEKSKRVKHAPKTLEQILSDALNKEVNRDPELRRELAYRKAGYSDLLKTKDPIEEKKKQIKDKVVSRALDKIDQDPELSEKFVDRQVSEIMGSADEGDEDNDGEFDEHLSPIEQALEQKHQLEELEREFGGGQSSMIRDLANSEFAKTFAQTIANAMFANKVIAPPEKVYVVQIDGHLTEMPESQYRAMINRAPNTSIALPETKPTPAEIVAQVPKQQIAPTYPALPEPLNSMDLSMIGAYLSQEPSTFVDQLHSEIIGGVELSQLIWNVLKSTNYDIICNAIRPFEKNPLVTEYIQQVLSPKGKEWVNSVIKLVREYKSEVV